MRRFVDLHLRLSIDNPDQTWRMIQRSAELGYHKIGIPFPSNIRQKKIKETQKLCKDRDLELITRVDLAPRTSKELLRKLRRLRRKFEVVAVVCDSKSVARQAAKDRRVDLLSFPPRKAHNRFFDRAEAELASNALSCLEIDMAPVLYLKEFPRIRLLSNLRTETAIAKKFNVPIVISSGATNEHLMRNGHDYAALATLFEISISTGLRSLSEIPGSIVERNRKKLCSKYVAPGIQVIKEGEDCPDK